MVSVVVHGTPVAMRRLMITLHLPVARSKQCRNLSTFAQTPSCLVGYHTCIQLMNKPSADVTGHRKKHMTTTAVLLCLACTVCKIFVSEELTWPPMTLSLVQI